MRLIAALLPIAGSLFLLASACVPGLTEPLRGAATATPSQAVAEEGTDASTVARTQRADSSSSRFSLALPAIADVAEQVRPAVVSVVTERVTIEGFFGLQQRSEGQGSGAIFDAENGYVLTNSHVVSGAQNVQVSLPDGRVFDARIVGDDPPTDLAVLRIVDNPGDLPVVELGTIEGLRIGDWVVAIGNALGQGISVTQGIISAKGRTIGTEGQCQLEGLVQTDAAINPGNSGGPLVDLEGKVVGINTAIARGAQGVGYAISIDEAGPIISQLIEHGRVPGGPYIGIFLEPLDRAMARQFDLAVDQGILVRQVLSGTPAQRAGLRAGDVLTRLNEAPLITGEDLQAALASHSPGDTIALTVDRFGQTMETLLQLAETPRVC